MIYLFGAAASAAATAINVNNSQYGWAAGTFCAFLLALALFLKDETV